MDEAYSYYLENFSENDALTWEDVIPLGDDTGMQTKFGKSSDGREKVSRVYGYTCTAFNDVVGQGLRELDDLLSKSEAATRRTGAAVTSTRNA